MDIESKKLTRLLEKAQLDEAFEHAGRMKDVHEAAVILSDFAVAVTTKLYDYESAELLLKKALSLNPKHAEAYFNLGVLYTEPAVLARDEKKWDDAEKAYLQAVKIKPDYMEAHYNLALLYHFSGRDDEADLEYAVFSELCSDKEAVDGLKSVLSKKIQKSSI
ncbi:MAG: tetratricopeptide repeat protein [Candidatus Altiarchaeota archaeon]|nr:tetratricopeptide repeat protein [Candidatus Altiarchaeota archaeon]